MGKELPDFDSVKKGALLLQALDNPLRLQLLKMIHHKEKATVTELYIALRIEQTDASRQLRHLREQGFVMTKRGGKYIYYSLNLSRLEQVAVSIKKFLDSTPRDYAAEFAAYTQEAIKKYKPLPEDDTLEGMGIRLKHLARSLTAYHKELGQKAAA